jgi:hypothetical protein
MEPIEQRVRESLQARAESVEPTPHLYRRVQERISRRQRLRVAVWSLAGAAAVAAAVLAVPTILGDLDRRTPEVADTPEPVESPEARPVGRGEPTHALLATDASTIELVDLADGSRETLSSSAGTGATVTELVAAPGGTADRFRAVAVLDGGDGPATVEVIDRTGTRDVGGVTETTSLPGGSGMAPAIAVSADGEWLAYTGISQTVDAAVAVYAVPIEADDATLDLEAAQEVLTVTAPDPPDAVRGLVQWTGPAGTDGDTSHLLVRNPDGFEGLTLEREGDGFITVDRAPVDAEGAQDVSSGFLDPGADPTPAFRLVVADDGEVQVAFDGTVTAVTSNFVGDVALEARGRSALLVGSGTALALRFPGPDTAGPPEQADLGDDVVAGTLLGGVAAESGEGQDQRSAPDEETGGLGAGLVVADDTTISLVRPDGSQQELVTFPTEGESTVVAVAVRPGSTADDLTVAITTRGEGSHDLRWLRVVDGETDTDPTGSVFPAPVVEGAGGFPLGTPDLQDGGEPAAAWSPDGDLLAVFVRPAEGQPAEIRTIGWGDDGPSDDPNLAATFTVDTERPLTLRSWSWTDEAVTGEIDREGQLLLVDRMTREAFTVRLDRQGDGAPSMPAADPLVRLPDEGILDVADADGDGTPDTALRVVGGPAPVLETRSFEGGEERVTGIELDAVGPRDVSFVATSAQVVLVVLDPAQPVLVDPATGDVRVAPIEGEVVSADVIR